MCEFKRLFNRKILWLILAGLLLNLLLYNKSQSENIIYKAGDSNIEAEISLNDARNAYSFVLEKAGEEGIIDLAAFMDSYDLIEKKIKYDEEVKNWALGKYRAIIRLKDNYKGLVTEIVSSAENQNQISIFNKGGDSTERSRKKTAADYKAASDISWNIKDTWAIESVLNQDYTAYILIVICLIFIWQLNTDKKFGFLGMIHLAVGGRYKLYIKRLGATFISSFGVCILLYGSMYLYALSLYGGIEALLEPMQLLEQWYRLPYHMTVLQGALFHIISVSVSAFIISCLLWLCIIIVDSSILSVLIFGLTVGLEYILFNTFGNTSAFALLHQWNIFSFIYPNRWLSQYLNIDILGVSCARYVLLMFYAFLTVIILSIVIVWVGGSRYPGGNRSINISALRRVLDCYHKFMSALPTCFFEIRKQLVYQRIWILFIVLIFICSSEKRVSGVRYTDTDGNYLKEIYAEYTGPVEDKTRRLIKEMSDNINRIEDDLSLLDIKYEKGDLSFNEYNKKRQFAEDEMRVIDKKLGKIEEQVAYLDELKNSRNIDGWLLDERGYEAFMGKQNFSSQQTLGLISIFVAILIGVSGFAYEKRSNMLMTLRASGGRKKSVIKIYMAEITLVIAVWLIIYGYNLLNMLQVYGLKSFEAPVQSIRVFEAFPISISIGGFFSLLYGMRLAWLLCVMGISSMIAYKVNQRVGLALGLLMLVPHILFMFGVKQMSVLSPVMYISFIQNWSLYGNVVWIWCVYLFFLVIGIWSYIYVIKDN